MDARRNRRNEPVETRLEQHPANHRWRVVRGGGWHTGYKLQAFTLRARIAPGRGYSSDRSEERLPAKPSNQHRGGGIAPGKDDSHASGPCVLRTGGLGAERNNKERLSSVLYRVCKQRSCTRERRCGTNGVRGICVMSDRAGLGTGRSWGRSGAHIENYRLIVNQCRLGQCNPTRCRGL